MIDYVHSEVNIVLRSKLNNLLFNQILVCKIPDGYVSMQAKIVNGSLDLKVAIEVSIEVSMDNKPYPVSAGIISTQMALDIYGESVSEEGNDIVVIDVVSTKQF